MTRFAPVLNLVYTFSSILFSNKNLTETDNMKLFIFYLYPSGFNVKWMPKPDYNILRTMFI